MAKSRPKRERPVSTLERKPGRREPRRCVLIVCEGAQTEPNYFRCLRAMWKLVPVEVEIIEGKRCGSAPTCVVDHAIRLKRQRLRDAATSHAALAFDEAWCVFDREGPQSDHVFLAAVDKAKGNGISLAVSAPAFEYWFLCHFTETTRPFRNADELVGVLREHLPDYSKGRIAFERLRDQTGTACERASRLWLGLKDDANEFPNPSTLVFKLVSKLREMSRSHK